MTVEDSPEKKKEGESPLPIKRKKKILNEPKLTESPDELMRMYCPEKFEEKAKGLSNLFFNLTFLFRKC